MHTQTRLGIYMYPHSRVRLLHFEKKQQDKCIVSDDHQKHTYFIAITTSTGTSMAFIYSINFHQLDGSTFTKRNEMGYTVAIHMNECYTVQKSFISKSDTSCRRIYKLVHIYIMYIVQPPFEALHNIPYIVLSVQQQSNFLENNLIAEKGSGFAFLKKFSFSTVP